jgi:hypothetical protein
MTAPANDLGPWFLAYTLNHGGNDMRDTFTINSDEAEARAAYARALDLDDLQCACIGPIRTATEPHWQEIGGV